MHIYKFSLYLLTLILSTNMLVAQTADEIINKTLENMGGTTKLNAIKTITQEGKVDMGQGREAPIKRYIVPNQALRNEFSLQGQTMVTTIEGNAGWAIRPFGGNKNAEPLPEEDVKTTQFEWDITGGLLNYAQNGSTAEYLGTDDFEGTDVYVVRLTLKTGQIIYHYIDTETYQTLKKVTKVKLGDKEQRNEETYSNFEKTDYGIVVPQSIGEQVTITKTLINQPIDDNLFKMPAKK